MSVFVEDYKIEESIHCVSIHIEQLANNCLLLLSPSLSVQWTLSAKEMYVNVYVVDGHENKRQMNKEEGKRKGNTRNTGTRMKVRIKGGQINKNEDAKSKSIDQLH